eukprot:1156085-Pelagomonas_calceolata.AAC.10
MQASLQLMSMGLYIDKMDAAISDVLLATQHRHPSCPCKQLMPSRLASVPMEEETCVFLHLDA